MKFILSLVVVLMTQSCATKNLNIVDENLTPLEEFSSVTEVSMSPLSFKINNVQDKRTVKDRVGMGRTGLSNRVTPIVISAGVEYYVKIALSLGLKQRGVFVDDKSLNNLNVDILDLWVEEKKDGKIGEISECKVKLAFDLALANSPSSKWQGQIAVQAASNGSILDATALNPRMISSCMNEALEKFVQDKEFQKVFRLKLKNNI